MARRRQPEVRAASPLPASKRLKTSKTSHVPAQTGLGFLLDEDARTSKKLEAKLTNGVPSSKTTRVDESHAVVAPDTQSPRHTEDVGGSPDNAIGISSGDEESESEDEDSSDDEQEDDEASPTAAKGKQTKRPMLNGHISDDGDEADAVSEEAVLGAEDVDMAAPEPEEEKEDVDEAELEDPSFGELLQARHPDPIDVQASFPDPMADRQALIPVSAGRAITAPSGTSLGTVLTQALKTNDKDLLESCFSTTDLPSIRSTIQRLQSQHVAILLQRLAERIHNRPGRTGSLLVWVQWSLIAHGGYLATQPDLMKKLKSLSQVIRERANGLQPLLHLKGKLDMLSAQLELRRNMQAASRAAYGEDDEDDEGVVYVEGQDDELSDSEDMDEEDVPAGRKVIEPPIAKSKLQTATPHTDQSDSEDDSESDDVIPNGVIQEGNDESSQDDEDEEGEGLFDMEAEETSEDDDDGPDEDSDEGADSDAASEVESAPSDDDSDAAGIQPPQPKTLNRKR